MDLNRRAALLGASLAAIASGLAPEAAAQTAPSETPPLPERLAAAIAANSRAMALSGRTPSGPGWDHLLTEARAAHFTLLGEEHGLAEVPALSSALFRALQPAGYERLAIEVSPPMAAVVDEAARGGVDGLRRLFADQGNWVAFYTLAQEAEFLADARRAVPGRAHAIWGLDYEVGADRRLIAELRRRAPVQARPALERLASASNESWSRYARTRNPGDIFSFGGDPRLAAAVRQAWPPAPAARDQVLLNTLEETLEINAHQLAGRYWQANDRRAQLNRANLIRYWKAEKAAGRAPKVLFKFGSYHMIRGRTPAGVFDIGTLAPEIAALEGGSAFHLLVAPGPGSTRAAFDPTKFAYASVPDGDLKAQGWEALAPRGGHTVFDLRPLRPLAGAGLARTHPELTRVIHGFDAAVMLERATAATPLV